MNIALIGATGNVGTRLISELRRRGHQVTAIARHPEKRDRQDGVNPVVGDVQNENALAAVLAGHDVAIHSVKFLSTDLDLSPVLRQMVKTHFSLNGELS